jgi:hypothetical protein
MEGGNYNVHMRRALYAALLAVSSIGFFASPAGADIVGSGSVSSSLSFDYSNNSNAASASGGPFDIIVNVLPGGSSGAIRIVAVAPNGSGVSNLVCGYREIQKSHAECAFNFTADGVWSIHAQMAGADRSNVIATAITNLRVAN